MPSRYINETAPDFSHRLVSAAGHWHIDGIGSLDDGSRPLKTHWGVRFDAEAAALLPAGLTSNTHPHGLIFTIGDPDGGHVLRFARAD